jgi:RHS repeat-associated protein
VRAQDHFLTRSGARERNGERTSASITTGSVTALTTYGYDSYGNLATATVPTGATVTYTSNADGLRQSATKGTTTNQLVWGTQSHVPLLLDDGTSSYIYGPSTTPFAQIADSGGTVQYLHSDLVGSVRFITNSSGTAIGTTEYDPYGNRTSHTGTTDSSIGYTGALTDPSTGLVYLRARNYDAVTGRFLSIDPALSITAQPYASVGNDPLQFADALGLLNGWAGTVH